MYGSTRRDGLLEGFRAGNVTALEEVYQVHVGSITRHLARRLGQSGLASGELTAQLPDLVQEVFLKAFSSAARAGFDGAREFTPYLFGIARNVFVDYLRSRRRFVLRDPHLIATGLDTAEAQAFFERAFDPFSDPQTIELARRYVAGLSPSLFRVYRALYIEGRSQQDAAALLGLGRQTIRTLQSKLRAGLRRELLACGGFHDGVGPCRADTGGRVD
jgi:RNA polymerase sigma factor (sigma-70 family)